MALPLALLAQTITIRGNVRNSSTRESVPAVSVILKGTKNGTFTDDKGNFRLTTNKQPPFVLVISSIGYESQEISYSGGNEPLKIEFKSTSSLGTEIVVSASRIPERILESPVSVDRIGAADIRNSANPNYYDALGSLNGVDVTNSSLTFTTITTRGFNGSGNPRFNQFVDGMDNQAPGLNFSVAAIVGLTDLDVDNMELLSGASSALYGSGGMNGTLLMTSKDPFKYQGVSFEIKQGVMHLGGGNGKADPISASPYYDWSLRWAQKIGDKFAFKISGEYTQAKDWVANDSSDYTGAGTGSGNHVIPGGTRANDPNYNGVNVYGDETSENLLNITNEILAYATQQYVAGYEAQSGGAPPSQSQINSYLSTNPQTSPFYNGKAAGIIPNQNVSRTGYPEYQIIDNTTISFKVLGGVYYKLTPNTQISLTGNWGTGNTVYTGADRYSLKDFRMGQYKLEIRNDNWFFRAYTTQERAGKSFDATVTTRLFDEAWGPSSTWYPEFIGAYLQAVSAGAPSATAFNIARAYADKNRPIAGSAQFTHLFDSVASLPIPQGGLLLDKSNLYQTEGQYNFTDLVKVMEVLVGATWRQYVLNSDGTLFSDSAGPRHTNEYGAYVQIAKKFFNSLKITASGRFDKNQNFEGKFTPRVSAVWTFAEGQNIRASYQNAYRFPSNQNQWINLNTGAGILIGGLPELRDLYHFGPNNNTKPVYTENSVQAYGTSVAMGSPNPALLQQQQFGTFKPESANSYELGYKGLFNKRILIDLYGYYAEYQNFLGRVNVLQPISGNPTTDFLDGNYQAYSVSVNSPYKIGTYGWGLKVDYLMEHNFVIGFNLSSDMIHNSDTTFATYWNTPKYRANVSFANTGFGYQKRYGYKISWRWQDSYFTQADFMQGPVNAFSTIDAQVNYKFLDIHSMLKLGATNLLNHYYYSQFGDPAIGGLYYISFAYNVF
jgi:outer membrane receptor protein involved in Fe transport